MEIDKTHRDEFSDMIKDWDEDKNEDYTDHEKLLVSQGITIMNSFEFCRRNGLKTTEHTSTENDWAILGEKDIQRGYSGEGYNKTPPKINPNGTPLQAMRTRQLSGGLGSFISSRLSRMTTNSR